MSLLLISGHTAGLQILAWGGMFVDNLGRMPVAQAFQRAAAPDASCRICYALNALRSNLADDAGGVTKAPTNKAATPKPDFQNALEVHLPEALVIYTHRALPEAWRLPRSWCDQPPVPPPQG